MGCSSSREVRGGVVQPAAAPAERQQGLPSRYFSRAASALASVGMCRGGHDGGVRAYTRLPFQEATASDPAAAERALPGKDAAAEEEEMGRHDAPSSPAASMTGAFEDAASATSSCTAQWQGEPTPSPPQVQPPPGLDPAILAGFRQTVDEPSPSHPALLYPEHENPAPQQETTVETCVDDADMRTPPARDIPEVTGIVRARVDELHEKMKNKKAAAADDAPDVEHGDLPKPGHRPAAGRAGKAAVVVYFTSLRGVRRTFEDGRAVRAILRCYRVRLDERDVSMHAAFKSELRGLLGAGFEGPALPRVFLAGGRHDLGGADDVRALHEAGELARALAAAGCEAAPAAGRPGCAAACAACGEMRFVPCGTCHGSCKVFADVDDACRLAGFFRRCPDCNENGLIRCPVCCY
ncbi:hypothetical protein ACP70R_002989 [Stipagrostis hirtigluma subsp. patula]